MNFNIGGPSNFASSSSDDYEAQLTADLEMIDAEEEAINTQHGNIQRAITQYLTQQNIPVTRGGSIPSHRVINRDRESVDCRLFNTYFTKNPRYNDQMFHRHFRMGRSLFLRIVHVVETYDNFFVQRRDSVGRLDEYLRSPNTTDVARLLRIGKDRGFPEMLGSIDCMHWKWKTCPTAWAGQYGGRSGSPTIILEAIVDYDMWIWHAYFGLPGMNNHINVLEASHLFANISQENELFAMKQEGCRKDVEHAFGVLQSRFAIVAGPERFWQKHVLHDIMIACIIMQNMIIEDERDVDVEIRDHMEAPTPEVEMVVNENTRFQEFLARYRKIRDKEAHIAL
ncbi:hypothetical protein Dsin_002055 [Dipteronia sinensis]|uniref:Nuclease HARBI1 n=1 Tax=Dipteronia sinensis TaxID=43782 RepID=A0AAE0B6I4_9ROSI|nr:hypothetical protein Dsin_002055 [Dipteronia sinensis]